MKKVLITCGEEKSKWTLNRDYSHAVEKSGLLPLILPMTEDTGLMDAYLENADGLLLSGGGDADAALYGEERHPLCGKAHALRDGMEMYLCKKALAKGIPVLGICRGVQMMNIALGGTLHQHIDSHSRLDLPRDAVHEVGIRENTRLEAIFGKGHLYVNSRHHQAVKDAAPGLVVNAVAQDGTIEGVELPGNTFFLGVQWHPESMFENYDDMKKIFAAFAAAVKGNK